MLSQDHPASNVGIQNGPQALLGLYAGEQSILTSQFKPKARITRTVAVLKQCAWCGAINLGGRFYLHHRLSSRGWVLQFRVFSWLLVTAGISHGLCDSCADGIRQRHSVSKTGVASA